MKFLSPQTFRISPISLLSTLPLCILKLKGAASTTGPIASRPKSRRPGKKARTPHGAPRGTMKIPAIGPGLSDTRAPCKPGSLNPSLAILCHSPLPLPRSPRKRCRKALREATGPFSCMRRQASPLQMAAWCAICTRTSCQARGFCGQNAPGSPRIRPGDRVCDMLLLPQWAARSATSLARVQRSVFLYPHTVIYCLSVPNPLHLGINISACLHISALVQFASICTKNSAK